MVHERGRKGSRSPETAPAASCRVEVPVGSRGGLRLQCRDHREVRFQPGVRHLPAARQEVDRAGAPDFGVGECGGAAVAGEAGSGPPVFLFLHTLDPHIPYRTSAGPAGGSGKRPPSSGRVAPVKPVRRRAVSLGTLAHLARDPRAPAVFPAGWKVRRFLSSPGAEAHWGTVTRESFKDETPGRRMSSGCLL